MLGVPCLCNILIFCFVVLGLGVYLKIYGVILNFIVIACALG